MEQGGSQFVYFVPPEFQAHAHIHAFKVRSLRDGGMQAEAVAVVSWRRRWRRPESFAPAAGEPGVRILGVPHRALTRVAMTVHLARALLGGNVTAQVLRCPWPHVAWLRRLARRLHRHFCCVLELEGDPEAEAEYLGLHPYRDGFYDQTVGENRRQAPVVRQAAEEADGLVLMSHDHIRLWEERLGRRLSAVAMPALFDPQSMRFDPAARDRVRRSLQVGDRVVLVYSGNVLCSWQKFGSVCRLAASLKALGVPVFLLAMVREADHSIAEGFIAHHAVGAVSRVLWSPPDRLHEYLSSADLGVFLRDDHPMNRIVTSAKLGEYLACGLPVITTGVGALYHEYIRSEGVGIFLSNPKEWDFGQTARLLQLAQASGDPAWRAQASQKAHRRFLGSAGPAAAFVDFIRSLSGRSCGSSWRDGPG